MSKIWDQIPENILHSYSVVRFQTSGARRRAAGAPAQHCHGPTQGPSPARPRPDLRYLGTRKSRSLESHGTLATKISEFWTYWNPCVKDFRILDLLEPLRQRFSDFQITLEILSIYGRTKPCKPHECKHCLENNSTC